jgi:hypothetical protein
MTKSEPERPARRDSRSAEEGVRMSELAFGPYAVKVINHLGDEVMKVFRVE